MEFFALFLLFTKHFICDFPLQAFPWMYRNKGIYMHPGGLTHAGLHGLGTLFTLIFFIGGAAFLYALIDFLVHYHIDYAKMKIGKHYDLQPHTSERFWILLGLDQYLHHATYFAIVYCAFNMSH